MNKDKAIRLVEEVLDELVTSPRGRSKDDNKRIRQLVELRDWLRNVR